LPAGLRAAIADAEALTAKGKALHLRLAIDYSARQTIYQAASKFYKVTNLSSEAFGDLLAEVQRGGSTEVDLLIRTGGEQRLSDFLLWECAFAEFVFFAEALAGLYAGGPAECCSGIRAARTDAGLPAPGVHGLARWNPGGSVNVSRRMANALRRMRVAVSVS